MSATVDIQVDTADVSRLLEQMDRARAILGKGMREAVQWGAVLFAQSLAARTKVSKKKRDVVDMPIQRITKRNEADRRYAPFAMKKWSQGVLQLRPLAGHGKGGYTRYKNISEAKKDRRVKIGRRGLAKKSWTWAVHHMMDGGAAKMMGVPDVAIIQWEGGYVNPAVRITNRLRYMEKALEGGYSAVQSALNAASRRMESNITRLAKEAFA